MAYYLITWHILCLPCSKFFETGNCRKSRFHRKSSSRSLVAADAKSAKSCSATFQLRFQAKKNTMESPACLGGSWMMPQMSHNIVATKRYENNKILGKLMESLDNVMKAPKT